MLGNADTLLVPLAAESGAEGAKAWYEAQKFAVIPATAEASAAGPKDGYEIEAPAMATAEASAAGPKDGYEIEVPAMAPAAADAFKESSQGLQILVKRLTDKEPLKFEVKGQDTVADLKSLIQEHLGLPPPEQKLLMGRKLLQEDAKAIEEYGVKDGTLLTLLVVEVSKEEKDMAERDMTTWDVEGNSRHEQLTGSGGLLTCPSLKQDYISVVAKAPIVKGRHYFQFTMHMIKDEEWVGVTPLPEQANSNPYPTALKGWIFYCGRMRSGSSEGALNFMDRDSGAVSRVPAPKTKASGDVIGMAIDLDNGKIAFDLNGAHLGADSIPIEPMWIITTVDTPEDSIEVQKLPLVEMPEQSLTQLGR